MSQDIMEKLKSCKQKLEAAEKEKVILDTKLSSHMEQLKDLGYNSIKEAQEAISDLEQECETLEDTLEEKVHEFEKQYSTLLEQ